MTICERAAYLKGLCEGLGLDEETGEGKVLRAVVDLLGDMCSEISELQESGETLEDYVDELDHDLGEVEEVLFEIDDDDDFEDDDEDEDDDDDDEDDDDDVFVEVKCPKCGERVYLDESIDPEDVKCPNCGEAFDCTCDDCEDDE